MSTATQRLMSNTPLRRAGHARARRARAPVAGRARARRALAGGRRHREVPAVAAQLPRRRGAGQLLASGHCWICFYSYLYF